MRIAFIVCQSSPKINREVVDLGIEHILKAMNSNPRITVDFVNINNYEEAGEVAQVYQRKYDALLFAGRIPYYCALRQIAPTCLWDYVIRETSSLLRVMLQANQDGYDIERYSLDSFTREELQDICLDIGEDRLLSVDYENFRISDLKTVYQFHKQCYESGKVSCCFTTLSMVEKRLREEKIPAYCIVHDASAYRQKLRELYYRYQIGMQQSNQTIVIAVGFASLSMNSILTQKEHDRLINRLEIEKRLYQFAASIDAAITQAQFDGYLLFCTKEVLENVTDYYKSISLLNQLEKESLERVCMGIGYGATIMESKCNAVLAMEQVKKREYNSNTAMVLYPNQNCWGPVFGNHMDTSTEQETKTVDSKLKRISDATGIGINRLFQLKNMVINNPGRLYTACEVARECGVSERCINRIIKKLELADHANVVGKRQKASGRPQRLIEFNL